MSDYRRETPRALEDAMQEAKWARLYFVVHRQNRDLFVILYAFNRVVGTIDVHAQTLTFPDPHKPTVRDVYPADAVRLTWEDCRQNRPPADPVEDSHWWARNHWRIAA